MEISGVILAGGKSNRMGQNKSLLKMGDKTIIELIVDKIEPIFDEIILVTNSKDDYNMFRNVRIVPDVNLMRDANSLIGLYTGLLEAIHEYAFVIPCDMPFIDTRLIKYMIDNVKDYDIIVPYLNGFYQSLHTIYKKSTLGAIESLLDNNIYKISKLFEDYPNLSINKIHNNILDDLKVSEDCFLNLNTPAEYERAKELYNRLILY